mgnify:CR=1 FL=1
MAWIQQSSGMWKNTAGDEYNPASYMTDEQYQQYRASVEANPQGIDKYQKELGVAYQPQTVDLGDMASMSGRLAPGSYREPTQEMIQRGTWDVINEVMRLAGPIQGPGIVGNLAANGFFNQFPDFDPNAFGSWLASRQSEVADRSDFMGINNLDTNTVSALSWLAAPVAGMAGVAGAGGTAAGTSGELFGAGLSTEAMASGIGGMEAGAAGAGVGTTAGGGYDMAGNEIITPGGVSGGFGEALPIVPTAGGAAAGAAAGTMLGEGGGAATGAATGAGTGTALSRLLDNEATTADLLGLGGILGSTALGVYGANRQTQSLEDLAGKYMEFGAPSRARYEASFAPGFSMANEPGYTDALNQAAKGTLHGLSAKFGNPADSPNAWKASLEDLYKGTAYPALTGYRSMAANAGGISRFAEAAPGVATGAISSDANKLNAIGAGMADIFNPPRRISLQDLMRSYG